MQDGRKAVWSIPYVSVAFFPTLKHNFINSSWQKEEVAFWCRIVWDYFSLFPFVQIKYRTWSARFFFFKNTFL